MQHLMVDILEARHAAEAVASPAKTVGRQQIHAAPRSSGEPQLQPARGSRPASVAAPGVKIPSTDTGVVGQSGKARAKRARRARGRAAPDATK